MDNNKNLISLKHLKLILNLFFLILMCGFFKLNNLFYLFIFNLPDNIW